MKSQYTIGVFGILFDERGRVLLCHRRDHDLWNLPGGGLDDGESPWGGLRREIKEETGLDAEIVSLVGVYSKPDKNEIVLSFVCKVVGGKVILNDEADKIEYFEVDKLPTNTVPKQVERIKDAVAHHSVTVLKVQTGPSSIELVAQGKLA